jgi:hypothetical protein
VQSDTPCQLAFIFRQQEPPIRWGVVARKLRQFLLKTLKAEIDAERLRILQKEFTRLGDLRGRLRLRKRKSRNGPRYPMSMPPLTLNT